MLFPSLPRPRSSARNICGKSHVVANIYQTHSTHRVSAHQIRVVAHDYEVDDGQGRIENIGAEEVFVEGDPLAAQTPVWWRLIL